MVSKMLLTDGEIQNVGYKYGSSSPLTPQEAAKAQLKKVDRGVTNYFETEPWMTIADWQALLEEVKDGNQDQD